MFPVSDLAEETMEQECLFKDDMGMKIWEFRHSFVSRLINSQQIKSVLDLGCSTGTLLQRLSRSNKIQLLVGVDIDDEALNEAKINIVSEAIQNDIQYYRDQNQVVEVYKADITNEISLFRKMHPELITLVEVIEHLESEAVTKVLENIFAYIRPRFVVVTTPNADFNVHFGLSNGKFRHWDHKFEWSRNQFVTFCTNVKLKYRYDFTISGVGEHHSDQSKGFCSQIAVFEVCQTQQTPKGQSEEGQTESVLVSRVVNQSWKSQKESLLRNEMFKTLRINQYEITWERALEDLQDSRLGQCLSKEGDTITKESLINAIKAEQRFVETDNGFKLREYFEEQNLEEGEYQIEADWMQNEKAIERSWQEENEYSENSDSNSCLN